jgi:hypothetical protein
MRCPFCGSSLEKDAKYCNDCGTAVDSECKGKNVNYRSYTVGRPEQTVNKTPSYTIRPNNAPVRNTNRQRPAFQNPQTFNPNMASGQFGNPNVKPVKKNGCAIAILIVVGLLSLAGVLGAVFEDIDFDSEFSTEPDYEWNYEYDYGDYDSDEAYVTDEMNGYYDGSYYMNNWVNFAFRVPDDFNEASEFTFDYDTEAIPDVCLENEDGDYILTGYFKADNVFGFLNDYLEQVRESMSDSDYSAEISAPSSKQVGNNGFVSQSVTRSDGKTATLYVCSMDDWVFFVEINATSAELNKLISDSFVNAYTTD